MLALCAGLLAVGGPAAAAQTSPTAQTGSAQTSSTAQSGAASVLEPTDPSSTVLPELNRVPVRGPGVDAAVAGLSAVRGRIEAAVDAERAAVEEQEDLARALAGIETEIAQLYLARDAAVTGRAREKGRADLARERAGQHLAEAEAAQALLTEVALQAYVGSDDGSPVVVDPGVGPGGRRTRYLQDVLSAQRAQRAAALSAHDEAVADEAAATARMARYETARLAAERRLADRAAAVRRNREQSDAAVRAQQAAATEQSTLREVALAEAKARLADARRTGTVVGTDLPLVVLDAFVRAVAYEAAHRPACRLDWPLLAAISRVESGHGTFGGSRVDATGQTSMILGPPLTPGSGFAVIEDTDGGLLDGDPRYDRAVGPMQFIPSSWRSFALDGDADGDIDPLNYYDAALAAAEHLCRGGADVATEDGTRWAVLGYNASEEYLSIVTAFRERYRRVPLGSR